MCSYDLPRVGYHPDDRGGGGDSRVREVDLALTMPHAPREVPVGRRYRLLPRGQHSHVAAEAWPACRRGYDCSRIQEDVKEAFLDCSPVDTRTSGDDDESHSGRSLLSLQDPCGYPQVFHPAVRAGADDHLVEPHVRSLPDGHSVARQRGQRHLRLDIPELDIHLARVAVFICLDRPFGGLNADIRQVTNRPAVHREYPVLRPRLDYHVGHRQSAIHRKTVDPVACELQGAVSSAVNPCLLYTSDAADDLLCVDL